MEIAKKKNHFILKTDDCKYTFNQETHVEVFSTELDSDSEEYNLLLERCRDMVKKEINYYRSEIE